MTEPFEERQKAFSHKYGQDAARAFTLDSRAARALAFWAAEKLGKGGAEAEAYVASRLKDDLETAYHERLFNEIAADFEAASLALDLRQVKRRHALILAQTRAQMQEEEEKALDEALAGNT